MKRRPWLPRRFYLSLDVQLLVTSEDVAAVLGRQSPDGQVRAMATAAENFREAMAALPGIVLIRAAALGEGLISDPSRQFFSILDTGLTGYQILKKLSDKDEIDAEKTTPTNILILFEPIPVFVRTNFWISRDGCSRGRKCGLILLATCRS